jgi:hypothetical protein
MNRVWGKAFVSAGLILMLGGTPSWGGPPNNDASDSGGNTAGGTGALQNSLFFGTDGTNNTADGFQALQATGFGSYNTAAGSYALFNNGSSYNTATGALALYANTLGTNHTATGAYALFNATLGFNNTATGFEALFSSTTGSFNTASGSYALFSSTTGSFNTAIGYGADVSAGTLINATAIGAEARVNASNKVRLGSTAVTVIEGQVPFTSSSDKTTKENFRPVDGEEVLAKIRGFALTSWNFIGHDPKAFRHYGPMAQDFFAAFGHDDVGQIGSETTINAGDMAGILMSAVQALEKRTAELKQKEAQIAALTAQVEDLQAKHAYFETVAARLERLEAAMARTGALASR